MTQLLRAPFPWFGGKSRAASIIWARFGDVANYIEPFAGSLAVLLARPTPPRIETVNDLDCNVANFWRATQADPEAVAKFADWPVNEADLHARHRWLVAQLPTHRERMMTDPDYFDAKIAGWWVWGQSTAILGNWLVDSGKNSTPHLGPPYGVQGLRCDVVARMQELAGRLRRTRVVCGDWTRAISATWERLGQTAVLLDPPYSYKVGRAENCYVEDSATVSASVYEWCLANGNDPHLRIALCGYEGEHEMPKTWECVPWSTGGMHKLGHGRGATNRYRERIWFSPHCLKPDKGQIAMFGAP